MAEYVLICAVMAVVFIFAALVLASTAFDSSQNIVSSLSEMAPCTAGSPLSGDECL